MAAAEREDIKIVDRTTVREVGDRFEIEWQLNARPELEWAEIFQLAAQSERHGSLEWVEGGGPDVIGTVVRWFVPSAEIENADAEVRHRLLVANERFGSGRQS
jgi:hypothetical protein